VNDDVRRRATAAAAGSPMAVRLLSHPAGAHFNQSLQINHPLIFLRSIKCQASAIFLQRVSNQEKVYRVALTHHLTIGMIADPILYQHTNCRIPQIYVCKSLKTQVRRCTITLCEAFQIYLLIYLLHRSQIPDRRTTL
jgi:hypothetical protein